MELIQIALAFAILASGWLGRYDVPVVFGVAAAAFFGFATDTPFNTLQPMAVALLLAYARRSFIASQERRDERADVG